MNKIIDGVQPALLTTFAVGVAAGVLIGALFFYQKADRDLKQRDRNCIALVERIQLISSLIDVIEIISKVPAATERIRQIGIDIVELINGKDQRTASNSPLDFLKDQPASSESPLDNERKKLDELIKQYYEVDKYGQSAEHMKNEYRYEISAQTCSVLRASAPIQERIPDYGKLVQLFCESFPASHL
jgi:hypothetical protein